MTTKYALSVSESFLIKRQFSVYAYRINKPNKLVVIDNGFCDINEASKSINEIIHLKKQEGVEITSDGTKPKEKIIYAKSGKDEQTLKKLISNYLTSIHREEEKKGLVKRAMKKLFFSTGSPTYFSVFCIFMYVFDFSVTIPIKAPYISELSYKVILDKSIIAIFFPIFLSLIVLTNHLKRRIRGIRYSRAINYILELIIVHKWSYWDFFEIESPRDRKRNDTIYKELDNFEISKDFVSLFGENTRINKYLVELDNEADNLITEVSELINMIFSEDDNNNINKKLITVLK